MATRPQQVRLKPPRGAAPRRPVVRDRSALPSDLAASVAALPNGHAVLVLVLVLDADGFRQFNGDHGFAAGDRALRMFSAALTGAVRHGDSAFRMGGDEF